MQKAIFLIILVSIILFSCTEKKENSDSEKVKAVVSILPYKYFVERIGSNKVEVETLIPPGASPHSFELNPAQLQAIQNSDFYFKVGGSFRFEKILLSKFEIDSSKIEMVDCSEGSEIVKGDPHIWLSPENVRKISSRINAELSARYPQFASQFQNNFKDFISELDSLDKKIKYDFSKLASNKFIVYPRRLGILCAILQFGADPIRKAEGKSLKAGDYKLAISEAEKINAKVLFADPHYDASPVRSIADELNIDFDFLDPLPADYLKNLEEIHSKFVKYMK